MEELSKYSKVVLAVLLFLCLLDMPYGYFMFIRLVSTIAFAYYAYEANEQGMQGLVIAFVVLAILFQPFYKVSLGRELWNIVDVLVGVGLIGYTFMKKAPQKD